MLYVFKTCLQLIRTLPVLQHDERDPEDVDTEREDHAVTSAGMRACRDRSSHTPLGGPQPAAGAERYRLPN